MGEVTANKLSLKQTRFQPIQINCDKKVGNATISREEIFDQIQDFLLQNDINTTPSIYRKNITNLDESLSLR